MFQFLFLFFLSPKEGIGGKGCSLLSTTSATEGGSKSFFDTLETLMC